MTSKEEILKILGKFKDEFKYQYKVKRLGIFGSYVKGIQKVTSDLDILVEFDDDADLFNLVGLSLFLEEKLQLKVDVNSINSLREEIKAQILNDVIYS